MTLSEAIMVLRAPFNPSKVFNELKESKSKLSITFVSAAFIILTIILLDGYVYNLRPQHLSYIDVQVPFKLIGFIIWLSVLTIILYLTIRVVFRIKPKSIDLLSITAISLLPITLCHIVDFLINATGFINYLIDNYQDSVQNIAYTSKLISIAISIFDHLLFGVLVAKGISIIYIQSFKESAFTIITVYILAIAAMILIQKAY